jgi:hypothetical protein
MKFVQTNAGELLGRRKPKNKEGDIKKISGERL